MVFVRWIVSMAMAAGITLGLFYFMQFLIATGESLDQRVNVVKIVDATMPDIEMEVIEEIDKPEMIEAADELYLRLQEASIDVLYDDRPERPGVKFNDMDLIGFPVRVVLGKRGLEAGEVELSLRRDGEKRPTPIDEMVPAVQALLDELRSQ